MNDMLRQRLVGLAVLLAAVFLLSLLLPGAPAPDPATPSTTVSLAGEQLLTEADAVPPPDDLPPEPVPESLPPAEAAVVISDVGSLTEPARPESPPPPPAVLKLAPKVAANKRPQDIAEPRPGARPPPAATITPKPKLAESVTKATPPPAAASAAGWYVQVGSFSDAGSAQTIVTLLKKLGVSAAVTRITGNKGNPLNRVRAGPYPSEAAARTAHARIAKNGYPQSRIVQEPSR